MKKLLIGIGLASLLLSGCSSFDYLFSETEVYYEDENKNGTSELIKEEVKKEYDFVIDFPEERYPETAAHIKSAIENGHSDICTIDRDGAEENREESLKGIDTKKGFDRDEWPMAMCEEGGAGASVRHINPSDNRGAGSWVGHQLSDYPDGTRVLFIVE